MSEERSNSVWPWIAALLIGLPTLYVASFGPACWLGQRDIVSVRTVKTAYRPIVAAMYDGPQPIQRALFSYSEFFGSLWFNLDLAVDSDPAMPLHVPP